MKAARSGQVSQAKPFGRKQTGPDGMEYALNAMTGRYEPTGFKTAPGSRSAQHRIEETGRGIGLLMLPVSIREQFFCTSAAAQGNHAPRSLQDETGTYLINLDNHQRLLSGNEAQGSAIVKARQRRRITN